MERLKKKHRGRVSSKRRCPKITSSFDLARGREYDLAKKEYYPDFNFKVAYGQRDNSLEMKRRIVEVHGGRITFHPNKDKGTIFVVAFAQKNKG